MNHSMTLTGSTPVSRPVERYLGGIHHLAQPTCDPRATIDFYVGVMGAKITHCVSSRGWRPGHYDYIHMFLDLGKGDNIAMFYYFGVEDPARWPKYGSHHSFAAGSLEELEQWARWLQANGYRIHQRNTYEVMSSIYVFDPNGRYLEIAANHRPLNETDAIDAELTAEALKLAADERAKSITRMWELKAGLVQERQGVTLSAPAIIFPKLEEFSWIPDGAGDSGGEQLDLGAFTGLVARDDALRIRKPAELPESLWWTSGTGGVEGRIESHDERELVITR
jgi:catechol 2,3-dioxygenase-like lactoylglutathione lyase family enzyme